MRMFEIWRGKTSKGFRIFCDHISIINWSHKVLNSLCWSEVNNDENWSWRSEIKQGRIFAEAWSNLETSFNVVWSQDQSPGYRLQACLQVAVKIKCEIWKDPCLLKHNIQPSYKPCKLLSLWRVFVLRIFTTRQISPVSNVSEISASFYTVSIFEQNVSTSYKYTVRSIVCEVNWSLGHFVTQSLNHFGHSVTRSLDHSVTWSLGHSVTIFNTANCYWHTHTHTNTQH